MGEAVLLLTRKWAAAVLPAGGGLADAKFTW